MRTPNVVPKIHAEQDMGCPITQIKRAYIDLFGLEKWCQHHKPVDGVWHCNAAYSATNCCRTAPLQCRAHLRNATCRADGFAFPGPGAFGRVVAQSRYSGATPDSGTAEKAGKDKGFK
jgi:hypothetical protein